jgi:pimeloyl-ACP methyl ester carboxylesterase
MGLAADYPYDVASLVLEEAAIHLLRNATPSMVRMMAGFEVLRRLARNERGAAAQMFRWSLSYSTGGSAFDRFPADWQESMLASAPAAVREVDHLGRSYPTREQIGSIECPVTWIEGTLSEKAFHKCHRYALKLLSHGPHSVTIDGGCHALHFDRPGEFARAVRDAALAGEGVPG